MSTKEPLGRYPRGIPIQIENEEGDVEIPKEWGLWLEGVRRNLYDIRFFNVEVDPPSLSSNASTEVTVASPEVEAGDAVLAVNKPTNDPGYIIGGTRATAGNIHIAFSNVSTGTVDPGTETYTFVIIKG